MLIYYCYFANKFNRLKNFQFHNAPLKIHEENGKIFVYDPLRRKNILLTPEEEVRQKLLWYLNTEKNIPLGLIAIERGLKINGLIKRFDIVVYNNLGKPCLAVECKSPLIKLTQKTMEQLAIYNLHLKAEFLMISNGFDHLISRVNFETREIFFLNEFPNL